MILATPPGRGRRPAPVFYGEPRTLTEIDLVDMWKPEASGLPGVGRIKALRYNHHLLAKAVASGKSLLECSQISGMTGPRISELKNDPAFQELVSFYSEELHEVYVDVHQRMAALGTSVLEELQERFENEPEKFSKRELMDLFTTMADRSIATAKGGPKPQNGMAVAGGAGLALQINFVSPSHAESETIEAQVVARGAKEVRATLPDNSFYPPGIGLDGEPLPTEDVPAWPSPAEIVEARYAAIDAAIEKRAADTQKRDALRAEALAKRFSQNG